MWASLPETDFNGELDATGAELVIAGHTGIPFTRFIGSRCWHNSGALGMPANDGTQRVWVSVLAPLDGSISITHHALQVDGTEAAAAIRRDGLPAGYADGLGNRSLAVTGHFAGRRTRSDGRSAGPQWQGFCFQDGQNAGG
jgi:hypothetical protein